MANLPAVQASIQVEETQYTAAVSESTLQKMGSAINYINNQGVLPSGMVAPFAGSALPTGWLWCDGSSVSTTTYAALFSALSYSHGGSGASFNLPDYRGQFLRGTDNMGVGAAGRDPNAASRAAMAAGGNTGNAVGTTQGQATAKNGLALSDPGHSHTYRTDTASGTFASVLLGSTNTGTGSTVGNTTGITLSGDTETRPINAAVNYIIKT